MCTYLSLMTRINYFIVGLKFHEISTIYICAHFPDFSENDQCAIYFCVSHYLILLIFDINHQFYECYDACDLTA